MTLSPNNDVPSVSVIMPAYCMAEFIGAAIGSVLNQTFNDFEIIVVNDGSPDTIELERALEPYREHIVYVEQANRGCSAARNAAIGRARGGLIAFLDADDYWEPEYLSEQVKFLETNPSVDLVYTDGLLVGESPLAGHTFMKTAPSTGEVTLEALLRARCTVLLSGTVARRQAILDVGLFDERLRCSEDYDLWLRLAMGGGRLAYQRKVLLCKRIHTASLSADDVNLHKHALLVLEKTRRDGKLSEREQEALTELVARLTAAVNLARAKRELAAGDFAAATEGIKSANGFYRSWKLRLMLMLLRYSPRVLLHVFNLRGKLICERASAGFDGGGSFTVRAAWLFFAKTFAFGLSFILPMLLVRQLSQHEFGLYKQVFLIVGTAIYVLPLGFGMSAFYFLPRERKRRDQVVFNILLFYLLMGGAACVALLLRPSLLATVFSSDEITGYAPLIGLVILLWVVSSFLEVAALANQESRLATIFIIVSQLAKTLLMLAAALALASVEALVYAAIIHGILQTTMLLLYLRSRFGIFWRRIDWAMVRTQMAYALPIGLASVLFLVQADLHNYFVSHQFSAAEFAIYAVGCFNLPFIGILSECVGSVTIPRVSYLQKNNHHRDIVELIANMMRKLAALYFPIYFFLLVTGREFITVLFTSQYESSWPIFAINLTMIPLGLVASACDPAIRAYAEHRYFIMKVRAAVIAALCVALWFGTRRFGLLGAIAVVVVFNLVERAVIAAKVVRILGVKRRDAALLKDIGKMAAAAFAAAVAAWTLRSFLLEASPLVLLAACGIVFCLAYVAGLQVLGVLTSEEREFIARRLRRPPRFVWKRTAVPLADTGMIGVGYGMWGTQPVTEPPCPPIAGSPVLSRSATTQIHVGELTPRRYWDLAHASEREFWETKRRGKESANGTPSLSCRIKRFIKLLLGKRLLDYMGSYEEYLLWNSVYGRYMPRKDGARVLEVGSAPGDFVVKLSQNFNFVPYGIEYSDSGVELNRQIFAENNINPNNVIHGDFLSDEFHNKYQGKFDIVISRGFIEHFTDAKGVVEKHINLLAKGGLLIVSIPNLHGFNYLLARIFHKEVIAMHNLSIMRKREFAQLFDRSRLSPTYCDYSGTFNFGLFNVRKDSPLHSLLSLCMKLQVILNVLFRLLLRDRGAESRFFSPTLIFIGTKLE
jgi:O-antigen/teichoic acid export membrane protein/GT2 family glycosyltransferase/2-polyprenyl-3-methyl-5-hydroxy-6-metoxy-1,4-benzoquinol methylase